MSLKAEIEIWVKALENFDARDYTQSLAHFAKIADSSRILFNVGLIHANMGQHQTAIVYYDQAQRLDQYFALSFFQCGVSFFLIGNYEAAAQHFQDAYIHLRENATIDYEQIGLKFKLYSAEVLFNQGLSYLRMNQTDQGMRLLDQARKEKEIPEHNIVDEALAAFGRDFTVFSVPTGMLFRPSDLKVKNLKAKNYLGKAKLVAATSPVDAFVGFSGVGAKPATSSESSSPTTSAGRKQQSPPIHSRSKSTPIPVPSVSRMEGSDIPPLRLTKKKSSVDLRGGASPPFSVRPLAPSDPNMKLPRINTDVYKPSHPYAQYASAVASQSPPQSLRTLPSIASPMPPTPPDSDSGRKNLHVARRDTATTTLGYLADPYAQKRDTNFMDDLVSEYSTVSVEPFPRRPSLPSPNRQPQPQGQPADRVTTWAHNQLGTGNSQGPGRYARPSAPPSMQPSMGTLRRLGSRRFDDMQRLRSGSLDDHLSPTLASNQILDDLLAARAGEMLSFRLKLHFQDDIRGMSLDADTPWPEFYARLKSKFGIASMSLKYKDEDGTFVTIVDEDDWDSAIDAARENCRSGRLDGKLDIWIVEGSPTRRNMS